MKKFYFFLAALLALPTGASAFTAEEIAGDYPMAHIDLSQNSGVFQMQTMKDCGDLSWTMTISVTEGNKVKLENFLPDKISYNNYDFDMEGEFNPETNTITVAPKAFTYPCPGLSFLTLRKTIAKWDGVTAFTQATEQDFQSFNIKIDAEKKLEIEPWAVYDTNSKVIGCMQPYEMNGLNNIVADSDAPVEYYNLQGVRVENPEQGLYIRRQGNTISKVIIR